MSRVVQFWSAVLQDQVNLQCSPLLQACGCCLLGKMLTLLSFWTLTDLIQSTSQGAQLSSVKLNNKRSWWGLTAPAGRQFRLFTVSVNFEMNLRAPVTATCASWHSFLLQYFQITAIARYICACPGWTSFGFFERAQDLLKWILQYWDSFTTLKLQCSFPDLLTGVISE